MLEEKIRALSTRAKELECQLSDPTVFSDKVRYLTLSKEYRRVAPVSERYDELLKVRADEKEAARILEGENDRELKELARSERTACLEREKTLLQEIRLLLLPKDEKDDANAIMEIRAGAGGDEATLFAAVLYRMYSMYAASAGFRISLLSANETELGGYREIVFLIEGEGAFARFKYESGVHRVQRVPVTESQGRIQTSTVTVAILPEAEEVEVQIDPTDIEMESMKSSGAGGQHINKTESAVRLLHKPTGIVVECREERSQFKNRDKAMKLLRTRLYEMEREKKESETASSRRTQIGTGDRSERVRTYNYPQGRVTDHRIGLTLYTLGKFLDGDIGEMLEALREADLAQKLKEEGESDF